MKRCDGRWFQFAKGAGVVLSAAVLSPAWGQSTPDGEADGTAAGTQLEEMVVRAGRITQTQNEAIAPISVIDAEALQQRQARDLSDILRDIPGVTAGDGPRRDAFMPVIRGLSDGRVVVRIDGARQNFQIDHRGQTFLDPSLLQRVEVLRGPASTLFGSGAIGGVVDFRTRDADDLLLPGNTFGGMLTGGYQSNADQSTASVTLGARGDRTGLLGSFTRSRADDYTDGNDTVIVASESDSVSGMLKAHWDVAPALRLTAGYIDFRDDSPSLVTADRPGGTLIQRISRQRTSTLRTRWQPLNSAIWNLDTTVYRTELQLDERNANSSDRRQNELLTTGIDIFNNSRVELAGMTHLLTYGMELYRDEQTGLANGAPNPGFASSEQDTLGFFVQDRILITARTSLTLGLRYDDIEQTAERDGTEVSKYEELSPQVTLSTGLTETLSAYASYAEAFRAPNLRELFVAGEHFPGNTYLPNPDLDPERARNKELGLRFRQRGLLFGGDQLRGTLSVYQNDIEDFIEQLVRGDGAPPGLQNTTRFENVADARLRGMELDLRYDHPAFYLAMLASRIRGNDRGEGDPLASIPADRVTLMAAQKLPEHGAEVGLRSSFVDRQDRLPFTTDPDAAGPAPGHVVLDAFMSWQLRERLRLDLRMDNLLDRAYRSATNLVNNPGRNLRTQLSYTF